MSQGYDDVAADVLKVVLLKNEYGDVEGEPCHCTADEPIVDGLQSIRSLRRSRRSRVSARFLMAACELS
jgi:hypothetical protein